MKSSKTEQLRPLPCKFVKAERLLLEALAKGDLSPIELCCWLIVRAHCIEGPDCFPSVTLLAKHLAISQRYTRTLVRCLEAKGFMHLKKRSGQTTIYEPLIYGEPLNHNSEVDGTDPGTTDQGLDVTPELQFTPPRNCGSGHPGSTVHTEVDVLKQMKEVEYVQPSADASPSSSAKQVSKTGKPKKASKRRKSLPLVKDPAELETILNGIELGPYREKWEPKGVNVDSVWHGFRRYVLTGSAKLPGPNPSGWRDFPRAFNDSCEREYKRNGDHKAQSATATTSVPVYQDLTNYQFEDNSC